MKTKILIATAISVTGILLCLNNSTAHANSNLAFKVKNNDLKTRIVRAIDTDLDGVTDDRDKCPDTPLGVTVNADGCPVVSTGDAYINARTIDIIDSDNDGIPDKYDSCPETPAGVDVDAHGCPIPSNYK